MKKMNIIKVPKLEGGCALKGGFTPLKDISKAKIKAGKNYFCDNWIWCKK